MGCCPFFVAALVILHAIQPLDAAPPATDLSCNFDDGSLCKWRSDSDLWMIGVNVPIDSLQFIPHPIDTSGHAVLAEGHLISAEVEEYSEHGAVLSFFYWKSNNPSKLDVCIAQQDTFLCAYTSPDAIDGIPQWIKQIITLPKNLSVPFKVVFRARNIRTPSDIVAVDEVEYSTDRSRAFTSSILADASIDGIPERTLASKQTISASCLPIRCTFIDSPCAWSLEAPWQQLEGNLALDTEGESSARSDYFLVPIGAFFEMDVWMSDNAVLTVLEEQRTGNESVIWTRNGPYSGDGWHRLRIPVPTSEQAVRLLLKGTVPPNSFITVSNTKLVNNDGNEIGCGTTGPEPIKPRMSDPERLTAYQQLRIDQEESTTTVQRNAESRSTTTRPSAETITPTQNLEQQTIFTTLARSLPSTAIPDSESDEIRNPSSSGAISEGLPRNGPGSVPVVTTYDANVVPPIGYEQQQYTIPPKPPNPYVPAAPLRNRGSDRESATFTRLTQPRASAQRPILSQYLKPGTTANNDAVKELTALFSQIGGQPFMEMQLRQLAQRFRFTQIDAEQGLKLMKNFLNSKGLQSLSAKTPPGSINQEQFGKPEPIRPVNAPARVLPDAHLSSPTNELNSLLSLLPVDLRNKFTDGAKGLLGENLSDGIVKRLSAVLSPPRANIDAQLPLTRNNLDFIVHNANHAAAAAAGAPPDASGALMK